MSKKRSNARRSPQADSGKPNAESPRPDRPLPETARERAPIAGPGSVFDKSMIAVMTALIVARHLFLAENQAEDGSGQVIALMWLGCLLVMMLRGLRSPAAVPRTGLLDGLVLLLLFATITSGVLVLDNGAARPALNMIWEWSALAAQFWLVRRMLVSPDAGRSGPALRGLIVVMFALAVLQASFGFYQVIHEFPRNRELYRQDPGKFLRDIGMDPNNVSRERALFENRLMNNEPLGTFALTNSLAGFLLPWFLVSLGLLVRHLARSATICPANAPRSGGEGVLRILMVGGTGFVALVTSICLLLTKSRSAYLGGVIGVVLIGYQLVKSRTRLPLGWMAAGVAVLLVAVVVAGSTGAIDLPLVTEAGKSLGYRVQYWQATTHMIAAAPWLGVGPGNFRDQYTKYKLAEASEEVADPHNFLFEIAATAGLPAAVIFVVILTISLVSLGRKPAIDSAPGSDPREKSDPVAASLNQDALGRGVFPREVLVGSLAGVVLAFAMSPLCSVELSQWQAAAAMVVLGCMLFGASAFITSGELPREVFQPAMAALLVNLLAAGGIGIANVAGSLWLMLGVVPWRGARGLKASAGPAPWLPVTGTVVAGGLVLASLFTGAMPVLKRSAAMNLAATSPFGQEDYLEQATQADPWSEEPWIKLATWNLMRWENSQSKNDLADFYANMKQALARRPTRSSLYASAAETVMASIFARTENRERDLQQAIQWYEQAVDRYPNLPSLRGVLAIAYDKSGDHEKAARQAEMALELNDLTPHLDLKIEPGRRQELEHIKEKN